MEVDSYQKALLAFVVHHAFNLEYPKKLKLCFQFLEEFVFGVLQKNWTLPYRNGVSNLLAWAKFIYLFIYFFLGGGGGGNSFTIIFDTAAVPSSWS